MNTNRKKALIEQEEKAIRAARNLSAWQIQASYFLALVNNKAMKNGRGPVNLKLIPGNPPTIERVD